MEKYMRDPAIGAMDPRSGHVALPLSVRGVVVDSTGRTLLAQKALTLDWELIGGRPTPRERFEACLVREAMEESGLDIVVERLIDAWPAQPVGDELVNIIVFGCSAARSEPLVPSDEHETLCFFPLSDLPASLSPDYRRAIETWHAKPRAENAFS
jgi:8-oxo-dGTP pyrophosphatase MutT (NUDIX family)